MYLFEFKRGDIFRNRAKASPEMSFKIYDAKVYFNEEPNTPQTPAALGKLDLYELSPGQTSSIANPYIVKNGNLDYFNGVTIDDFHQNYQYGDVISGSYPLTAGIQRDYIPSGPYDGRIRSLRSAIQGQACLSSHFSSNFSGSELALVSIPKIIFGEGIKKGSICLKFYVTGTLAGELRDHMRDGLLRETYGPQSGSIAGVALYQEGFLLLTGSHNLDDDHDEPYFEDGTVDNPKWIHWGTTGSVDANSDGTNVPNSAFSLNFKAQNSINVLTMMMHAPKGELNHSSNPTFIEYGQDARTPVTGSGWFRENPGLTVQNCVSSSIPGATGSFERQVYISKVAIYDESGDVLGYVSLARPLRKRERDGFTIKAKLDLG